jgi:hypothetical protein
MTVFAVLVFALIGLLGGLESYYLLFLVLLPLGFCCYREKSARPCLYLLATLAGVLFVLGYPKGNAELTSVTGLVIFRRENYYLLWSWSGKYYVYDKGGSLGLFSLVRLTGYVSQLSFTHYESQFSFEDYLKTQGVFQAVLCQRTRLPLFSSPLTAGLAEDLCFLLFWIRPVSPWWAPWFSGILSIRMPSVILPIWA